MNEERKCGMRTHVYTKVLLNHLRKEIMPFATTQMELEGTMLSVIRQYDLTCGI